jgi:meiosis-specific transcription factor NDT80
MPVDTRSGRPHTPPFEDTKVIREVMNQRGQSTTPEIQASIPKGFFEVEGKWTCYRRNYFPVSCSFSTKQQDPESHYYLQRDGQQPAHIIQFAVSISAKTAVMNNQDSQSRGLVQHTPKRDKATESTPGKVIIQPTSQISSSTLPQNIHAYSSPQHVSPNMILNYEPFSGGQQQSPPTQYTFERIQFQKATANNGKRRAQQQFFHVVVELWADVGRMGKSEWVEIATRQSAQMVVRGRSPGHYKDNGRRDSTTSMDPDRGTGASGDGGGGVVHGMSMLGGHSHSNGMDWAPTSSSHHYGGGSYRRPAEISSPKSNNSSGTFTGSPPEPDSVYKQESRMVSPTDTHFNPSDSQYHAGSHFDGDAMSISSTCKRPYDEDHSFTPSLFESRRPYHVDGFLPPHLDYTSSQRVPVS